VRAWLVGVVMMGSLWLAPLFYLALRACFGGQADTFLLAAAPAAICGYLSLAERGALVAFWYPAMLWMVVVLDGPVPGAFDGRAALPLVGGLAALFVAFLRARETRRAALWQTHGVPRLATALPRTVLRASPLRSASQVVWTGLVGAAALVLAAWIAPHLWQKDHTKREAADAARRAANVASLEPAQTPCCDELRHKPRRERVREYLPLSSAHDVDDEYRELAACTMCSDSEPVATEALPRPGIVYGAEQGSSLTTTEGASDMPATGVGGGYGGSAVAAGPPAPAAAPKPVAPAAPAVTSTPVAHATVTPRPHPPAGAPRSEPVEVAAVAAPSPPQVGAPWWRTVLAFCLGGLALHVLVRAARRQLTLRHLTRPLWAETLDQRISNHWERMLIGLRDAGIRPADGEQPQALARRVGIAGMETCATILERVRHGVRVDPSDLDAMEAAASAVYRAAREQAGVAGRSAAWLRWPLT
jgi:hypothetical protein